MVAAPKPVVRAGHIFLSHAGADTQAARELAEILRHSGVHIWFDKDDLPLGIDWMATLEKAIADASAMLVYVGSSGIQAWVEREVRVGLMRNTQDPTFRLVPVLGEGADITKLPAFVQPHQCVDLRDRRRAPEQIGRLLETLNAISSGSVIRAEYWATHNPFRSLTAFGQEDAWLFFGRDTETDELLTRLGRGPTLVVIGNSGSGKSSLVQAGLIPALLRGRFRSNGKFADSWRIAVFRPSAAPFDYLAKILPGQLAQEWDLKARTDFSGYCRKKLLEGPEALREIICNLIDSQEQTSRGTRVLLIADQFEELFTLVHDPAIRSRYIASLLSTACLDAAVPVHLVLALRADFYAHCLDHPKLKATLDSNLYSVPAMNQLRMAIDDRLSLAAGRAEPGLIDSLLADVGTEPGNLALLEHALAQLWHKSGHDRTLTSAAYSKIGRLRGAIGAHADEVLRNLDEADRPLAQSIFLELVELGDGALDTRRRANKENLLRHLGDPEHVESVIAKLASSRLLTTSGQGPQVPQENFVEVAHEALIREWPTLRKWLDDNREDVRLGRILAQAAEEWGRVNRHRSALMRGVHLTQARDWLVRQSTASALVREFVHASHVAEKQTADFRMYIIFGTAAVLVLLVTVVLMSARARRKSAEARELSAWTAVSLSEDPERSLILGLHSWGKQRAMVGGLEQFLHDAVLRSASQLTLRGHQGYVSSVAWSPDGNKLASASTDRTAKVWEASSGHELFTLSGHQASLWVIAWSPDGTRLATAGDDTTAKVWDAVSGFELLTLRGHQGSIRSISWSPDSQRLATASDDETARVWDAATGRELLSLHSQQGSVRSIAWSPDGNKLATTSDDKTAKVYEAIKGRELLILRGHLASVRSIMWSPDGSKIATASDDKTGKVWEASSGRELLTLRGHQASVSAIAWSPDGTMLAGASDDTTARLWEAETGQELLSLRGHQAGVWGLAWSPDGSKLATASADGTAKEWETGVGHEVLTLRGHQTLVLSAAWSPDGTKLATGSYDGTARVWDAGNGNELLTLRGHRASVKSIAWSPSGSKLATASFDKTAKVWEACSGRELLTLRGHQASVVSVSWSKDERRLATASSDSSAKLWEASSGRELLSLTGHQNSMLSVAWSPDGNRVATSNDGNTAQIWDARGGSELLTLRGHVASVMSVTWSPDGTKLATASYDKTAKVWNARTGRELHTLLGHQSSVLSIAWSPDGKELATASYDKTAKVWDSRTGRELLTLRGHDDSVTSLAWSPDGTRLATASEDKTVQIFAIDTGTLLRLVRSRITRDLTADECRRYLNTDQCPPIPVVP